MIGPPYITQGRRAISDKTGTLWFFAGNGHFDGTGCTVVKSITDLTPVEFEVEGRWADGRDDEGNLLEDFHTYPGGRKRAIDSGTRRNEDAQGI